MRKSFFICALAVLFCLMPRSVQAEKVELEELKKPEYGYTILDRSGKSTQPGQSNGLVSGVKGKLFLSSNTVSGVFGGSITWEMDEESGTLSISGSGSMPDTSSGDAPWEEYAWFIKKLVIGEGIISIGEANFYDCTYVTEIQLPTTLKAIGTGAFANCRSLKTVTFPEGLEKIGEYAFQSSGLTAISLPRGLKDVSNMAFFKSGALKAILVDPANPSYSGWNGSLYNKEKTELLIYPCGLSGSDVAFPVGITAIGECAFLGANITEVRIPSTVKKLGASAFQESKVLSFVIPDSVTEVGDYLCYQCADLKSVKIGSGLSALSYRTFFECTGLLELQLGPSLKQIDHQVFAYCESLQELTIPEGVETVQNGAFACCSLLPAVHFPSTLKEIWYQAFLNCESLAEVHFPESVTMISRYAFYGTGIKNVVLPSNIAEVLEKAFPDDAIIQKPDTLLEMEDGSLIRAAKLAVSVNWSYTNAYEILSLVNKARAAQGVNPLVMDEDMLDAAMVRAAELTVAFSHTRPTDLRCFSVTNKMSGENIAAGSTSPAEAMELWMNSPGHRANILMGRYTSIGIGCAKAGSVYYWVQVFGTGEPEEAIKNKFQDKSLVYEVYAVPGTKLFKPKLYASNNRLKVGRTGKVTYYCDNTFHSTPILPVSLVYESSDSSVCAVDGNGKLTALKKGDAVIKVYPKTCTDLAKSIKITVLEKQAENSGSGKGQTSIAKASVSSVGKRPYTGKKITPAIKVRLNGKILKKNADYRVQFKNNINPGQATVLIVGKGAYKGKLTKKFSIIPATRKWKSVKRGKKSALTLAWNGTKKDVTSYEIQLSTNKSMKKSRIYKVKAANNRTVIKKLKSKKRYYIRIRGEKTVAGKKYCGNWSKIYTVKVK